MRITDYSYYERKYPVNHRPRIDGKITGSNNCTGYCECYLHRGFLTKKLEESHECRKKQCNYYKPKIKKEPLTLKYIVQEALFNCQGLVSQ